MLAGNAGQGTTPSKSHECVGILGRAKECQPEQYTLVQAALVVQTTSQRGAGVLGAEFYFTRPNIPRLSPRAPDYALLLKSCSLP